MGQQQMREMEDDKMCGMSEKSQESAHKMPVDDACYTKVVAALDKIYSVVIGDDGVCMFCV